MDFGRGFPLDPLHSVGNTENSGRGTPMTMAFTVKDGVPNYGRAPKTCRCELERMK